MFVGRGGRGGVSTANGTNPTLYQIFKQDKGFRAGRFPTTRGRGPNPPYVTASSPHSGGEEVWGGKRGGGGGGNAAVPFGHWDTLPPLTVSKTKKNACGIRAGINTNS